LTPFRLQAPDLLWVVIFDAEEVAGSNPARPTDVVSRDIVHRCLGTSFHVQDFPCRW
jgi:hypothetical protein